jgi:hypothetical protein
MAWYETNLRLAFDPPMNAIDTVLNDLELARALRASLAHERARMRALLDDIAHVRMEVRDAAAIRSHVRSSPDDKKFLRFEEAGAPCLFPPAT